MVSIAIAGAAGRMGRALIELTVAAPDLKLVGALEHASHPSLGGDVGALVGATTGVTLTSDASAALRGASVVVDFSTPESTTEVLRTAAQLGVACVICTTGLTAAAKSALEQAANRVPVVVAANTSVGVQVLSHLLREALKLLGAGFDIEIVEAHHRHKVDAPSGTALRLAEIAAQARGTTLESAARHGRVGRPGPRSDEEIGIHSIRAGDVVADVTVMLAGEGERLELVHQAHSRAVFAAGALRAARWVSGRPAGRYEMSDVLGIHRG